MSRIKITRLHALTHHWIEMATAVRDMTAHNELYPYFQFTQGSMDIMDPFFIEQKRKTGTRSGLSPAGMTQGLTLFARQCIAVNAMNRCEAFLRRWALLAADIPNGLGAPSMDTMKAIRILKGSNRLEILEEFMSLLTYDMLQTSGRALEAETLSEIRDVLSHWLEDRRGFIYASETSPDHHQRVMVRLLDACLRLDLIISKTHPDMIQDWISEVSQHGGTEEKDKIFISDLSLTVLPRPDKPLLRLISDEESPPVSTRGFLHIRLHDAVSHRPVRPI